MFLVIIYMGNNIYIYTKYRNKRFLYKLYKLYSENHHNEALLFIDNAIKKRPKMEWLKTEKAIMLVLTANYTQFISYKDVLNYPKNYFKRPDFYRLEVINYTVDFLFASHEPEINPVYINNKRWKKYITGYFNDLYMAISKYQSDDFSESIYFSNKLLFVNLSFIKFMAYVILIKSYRKINDSEMEEKYKELFSKEADLEKFKDGIVI